jgi:hypothetical protein
VRKADFNAFLLYSKEYIHIHAKISEKSYSSFINVFIKTIKRILKILHDLDDNKDKTVVLEGWKYFYIVHNKTQYLQASLSRIMSPKWDAETCEDLNRHTEPFTAGALGSGHGLHPSTVTY